MSEQYNANEIMDNIESEVIEEVSAIISRHTFALFNLLKSITASLCLVDEADILSDSSNTRIAQARWFFWLSYRRATNATYEEIVELSFYEGHKPHKHSIINRVNYMARMINKEIVWKRRWNIMKQIINEIK